MKLERGRNLIVIASLVITALMIAAFIPIALFFPTASVGQNFLLQLHKGDEEAALDYLSLSFRDAISLNCPRGWVTFCFDELQQAAWGGLEEVQFVTEVNGAELFHTVWSDLEQPVSVVLEMRQPLCRWLARLCSIRRCHRRGATGRDAAG
jgi:hypothetical protein